MFDKVKKPRKAAKKKDIRVKYSKRDKDFVVDCNFGCAEGAAYVADLLRPNGQIIVDLKRLGYDVASIKFSVNRPVPKVTKKPITNY